MADENGSKAPLRAYNRKTVVITLPSDLTVFDIDYLSVWCEDFFADFGHVRIDKSSLNVPPSLKMLGVKPQVSPTPSRRAKVAAWGHVGGSRGRVKVDAGGRGCDTSLVDEGGRGRVFVARSRHV